MKTCPYCAEDIKDAAIRCRWCHAWIVDDVPEGADADRPPTGAAASTSTTSEMSTSSEAGMSTSTPSSGEPATSPKPAAASPAAAMTTAGASAGAGTGMSASEPAAATGASGGEAPSGDAKVEFTHTGSRFLLGYGGDFFGIWDRNAPQQPIERFPRNDQGWASAWQRYASIEQNWMDLRTGQKSQ